MEKIFEIKKVIFFIFSNTPEWFFKNSLRFTYEYIPITTDVGIIQTDPFTENLNLTLQQLDNFLPFHSENYAKFIQIIKDKRLDFIICDISPLGIWLAKQINVPCILIENFTWDWIYEYYMDEFPGFSKHIHYLREMYAKVDMRFSCQPFCELVADSIITAPVYRKQRIKSEEIRLKLAIKNNEKMVLLTFGGIPTSTLEKQDWKKDENLVYVFPVKEVDSQVRRGNIIYLPHNHPYFHPDLVNAADIVVGKLGYSTIAEVYALQKPFLYLSRKNFRESEMLEKFVNAEMLSNELRFDELFNEKMEQKIIDLVKSKSPIKTIYDGAEEISQRIIKNYA